MVINELEMREVCQTGEVIDWLKDVMKQVDEVDYKSRSENMERISKLREEYFLLNGKKPFS